MLKKIVNRCSVAIIAALLVTGCSMDSSQGQSDGTLETLGSAETALSLEGRIAQLVKDSLGDWTAQQASERMARHYVRLGLLDTNGQWKTTELSAISEYLLPQDIDAQKAKAFVDQIADAAASNEYLHAFLEKAQHENFQELQAKVAAEGAEVFPDVVAYAFVLERLTSAMRDNWRIMEPAMRILKKAREDAHIGEFMDWFDFAKLASVELPMKRFVEYHKSGKVPQDFLSFILPMNIAEASVFDLQKGYPNNARTGWTLMVNRPGTREYNSKTGAGPDHWSEDGNAIDLGLPFAREWADLYSTWNLAFVAQRRYTPYLFTKLLIPRVGDYRANPEEYIYDRAIALYLHLHWGLIRRAEELRAGITPNDWSDAKLIRLWGDTNRESAYKYESQVANADPSWRNWFQRQNSEFQRAK